MKVPIKVRIKKVRDAKETRFVWPLGYDSKKFNVLVYETPDEKVTPRSDLVGERYEWCLATTEQTDAISLSTLYPNDFKIVDNIEANTFGRQFRPQTEKILDKSKVLSVLKKVREVKPLSQDDLAIIDPSNPTPGVNYSKLFEINDSLV